MATNTNDDFIDNIMGDKDFTEFGEDVGIPNNNNEDSQGDINNNNSLEVYDANNELIGYQCPQVIANNPNLPAIPLTFYIDLKFPLGDEASAVRQVRLGLLGAIASDYHIATGKACTDPPSNGSSWLVSILSEADELVRETTFDKCRELTVSDTLQEECYVYEFTLHGKVLTGPTMPDVQGVVETLFVNQVTLDSNFQTKFLGSPKYQDTNDDKTNLTPPSNLNQNDTENVPIDRNTITIVGGLLVAAFCLASVSILCLLWGRRKSHLREQLEQQRTDQPKQFSLDTEESEDDEEYNRRPRTLDLSNSFNQQVLGAHSQQPQKQPRYLTNVNNNPGNYSHFQNNGQSHFRNSSADLDSDVDSWAQTDGTIGSLELQLEPNTAEI
jgi:hypothetical protein